MTHMIDSLRGVLALEGAIRHHEKTPTVQSATLLLAVALDEYTNGNLDDAGFTTNVDDVLTTLMEHVRKTPWEEQS
jgi:hypothetical protein